MAWNLSSAVLLQSDSTTPYENDCIYFKPDGTKAYSASLDVVHEYDLSTAWDISTISFLQQFNIGANISEPKGIFFKSDGSKMYILERFSHKIPFHEYDLGTPWDISTAVYLQSSVGLYGFVRSGLFFKPDGSKVYFFNSTGLKNEICEYDLGTPWDVSTATFLQSFIIRVYNDTTKDSSIFFSPDGTKMYFWDEFVYSEVYVYGYDLSTLWDVSTAVYSQKIESRKAVLFFNPTGTKLYTVEAAGSAIDEYDLLDSPHPIGIELSVSSEYVITASDSHEYDLYLSESSEYTITLTETAG